MSGCGSSLPTIHQRYADCELAERDPSIRNSIVVVSCVPTDPKAQLFVSSGTSLAGAAVQVADVTGNLPVPLGAMPNKGVFSTDDWAQSLVNKMDGSTFLITVPGLAAPVVVVYRRPQ